MTPILGVISCAYLMLFLAVLTWVRFLVWLDIGMVIYWFYSRTHSPLHDAREESAKSSKEKTGDFLTLWGGLGLFNGACIALVGLLSAIGMNTEATAKWHEVQVTPVDALGYGVAMMAATAALFGVGRMMSTKA